jgi:hypothetical protein
VKPGEMVKWGEYYFEVGEYYFEILILALMSQFTRYVAVIHDKALLWVFPPLSYYR